MEDNGKIWLDRLTTNSNISDKVLNTIIQEYNINIKPTTKYIKEYSCIINNIVRSVVNEVDRLYVSLNKNTYLTDVILNGRYISPKFKYTQVVRLFEELVSVHLIYSVKGYHVNKKIKSDGYIQFSEELTSLIKRVIKNSGSVPKFKNNLNSLVLLDKNGKTLPLKGESKMIGKEFVRFVSDFNGWMSDQTIHLGDKEITTWLCRIFKENLQQHGRFYNIGQLINYQTMSQIKRKELLINGEPVIELDYKHLHPSILYELDDVKYQGDMYATPEGGFCDIRNDDRQSRNMVKDALLRMINTGSRNDSLLSIVKMFNEEESKEIDPIFSRYGDLSSVDKKSLAEALVTHVESIHPNLDEHFYKDKALGLMGLDSNIMNNVLMLCKEDGIVALPIHDSIIVPESESFNASVIMRDSYVKVLGTDYNCNIEVK